VPAAIYACKSTPIVDRSLIEERARTLDTARPRTAGSGPVCRLSSGKPMLFANRDALVSTIMPAARSDVHPTGSSASG
jgi:hypothetical protein